MRDKNHASVILWSLGNESGHGAQPRGGGRLAARLRPEPAAPLRGRDPLRLDERPGRQRHHLPDVPADRGDRRARPLRAPAPPADHVRVLARDGQQQRDAGRVLGRHRIDAGPPGRLHLGVAGTTASSRRCRTAGRAGPMAAISATSPTTATSCCDGMVWPDRRPKPAMWEHKRLAAPVRIGGRAGGPRGRPGRDREPPALHRPRLAARAAYSLTVDGVEIAGGPFDLPALGPGERPRSRCPAGPRRTAAATGRPSSRSRSRPPTRPAGRRPASRCARSSSPVGSGEPATADRRPRRPPTDERRRARRRGPARPSAAGRPAGAVAVARPDRQRPDRRDGRSLGGARRGPPRAAARLGSSARRRRPSSATRTSPRHRGHRRSPHEAAYTRLADGGIRVVETVELPDELADLARVGTVLEVARRARAPALVRRPARTRPTRIASAAGSSASGLDRSPTSTSRTSARRRTAATPTSAGSS